MFKVIFFCLLISLQTIAFTQNTIGLPEVINYTKHHYTAGTQNWDIKQDHNGILYFANNEGMLSFDGAYWRNHPLPNKTIVRSLAIAKNGRIYAGGQDEIGYFSPDKRGSLVYTSLKNLLPEGDRMFTDVWDIIEYKGSIFFRLNKSIFELTGDKITVYKSNEWLYLGLSNGMLVAQDITKGLLLFKNGMWEPFLQTPWLPQALVTSFLPLTKDSSLVVTLKHGLFILANGSLSKMQGPELDAIAGKHIYTATLIAPDRIALATSMDGCFIINAQGSLVQHLSRTEGLQNNNVLSALVDRDQNIWLGLDNGIDFVAYNSAIKQITPDRVNNAMAYTSIIYNSSLYIGTSNGLYTAPLTDAPDLSFVKSSFKTVAKGQVWNLSQVNGQLLMGHHEGAFVINKGTTKPLDGKPGFWTFLPYNNVLPSALMVAGTYNGISFYKYDGSSFYPAGTAPFESARFVTIDNGNIWVSHPYKGIFNVTHAGNGTPAVKIYAQKKGLPSVNNNYVFKIKARIVAATEKGIYEYNAQTDAFAPSEYFKTLLPQKGIRYLKEDARGNIWFIYEKSLGVLDLSGPQPKTVYLPELDNKMVSGFEHVYFIDEHNVLVGGENGCYHINYEKYKQNTGTRQAQIRTVRAIGSKDSLLFGGYFANEKQQNGQTENSIPKLASDYNSFHLTFSATLFGQDNLQYSYYLKGLDKTWSEWTRKSEKEYTALPAGTYTFLLKARNNLGKESAISSYTFTILPPWYQTPWANFVYTALLIALAYGAYCWQKKKFARQQQLHLQEQKRLQYLHQLELEHNEREIIKLKNDRLEADIEFKNSELASSAMHLVQKGELIARLKDELTRLLKKVDNRAAAEDLKKLLRTLGNDDKMDKDWEHFSQHFDKVHSDLLVALKTKHPNLSPNELKLCAYLRMNLTSKEVAQLLNISVRGVEISRYRLRKKLQIATETNLFDYLISIQSDGTVVTAKPAPQVAESET